MKCEHCGGSRSCSRSEWQYDQEFIPCCTDGICGVCGGTGEVADKSSEPNQEELKKNEHQT
jgi:hypothetical protein